jgi:DNA-binding NarL/FixJ family response regulator
MACPTATTTAESTGKRLSVLVLDDSGEYLDAVSRLLATFPCIRNMDRALSASDGLAKIVLLRPDLLLLDVALPDGNGLDLTRTIKAVAHPPKIIVVTLYETPTYRRAALAAGADGFLGKSELGERLQGTIEQLFPELCGGAKALG